MRLPRFLAGFAMLVLAAAAERNASDLQSAAASTACGDKAFCNQFAELAATVQQLRAELKSMKLEVAELRLGSQRQLIALLASELQQVATASAELDSREAARQHETDELDQYLQQSDLSDEARLQAHATRAEVAVSRAAELESERRMLEQRDAATRKRLQAEHARLLQAERLLRELATIAPSR